MKKTGVNALDMTKEVSLKLLENLLFKRVYGSGKLGRTRAKKTVWLRF